MAAPFFPLYPLTGQGFGRRTVGIEKNVASSTALAVSTKTYPFAPESTKALTEVEHSLKASLLGTVKLCPPNNLLKSMPLVSNL